MLFKCFGNKNRPVIMFLHGGGLSWWSWKPQIEALQNDYYIIAPIIDGHGDAWDTTFISIENAAEQVIKYIKENCDGKVFAICGLSLGAQITVEILSQDNDIAVYAVIESALVIPIKVAAALTAPMYKLCYGLIKKRWYAKLQVKTLNVPDELFENYYEDSRRMTKDSLINITRNNGEYVVPAKLSNTKAKVLILVGGKELSVMRKSAEALNKAINHSVLNVIEKCGHGEISLKYPDKYLNILRQFFKNANESAAQKS